MDVLTEREREVVALVAQGLTNDEIATELVVSPATARTHVSRAMVKLYRVTAPSWWSSPTSPGSYARRRSPKCHAGIGARRAQAPTAWKPPSTCTFSPVVAGNQSERSATQALAMGSASFRSHPRGARSVQTSSKRSKPGMLLAAMLR